MSARDWSSPALGQQLFLAVAENAVGNYDVTVLGSTEDGARNLCLEAVRRERRRLGWEPWEYEDDISVTRMTVGVPNLDYGRAGDLQP